MSDIGPEPNSEEKLLARWLDELARRGDVVVEEFARLYPESADVFRRLARMNQRLEGAGAEPAMPERLGEFRIVREIARGGVGVIYEAVQERLKRRVAVKTVRQGRIAPEARERFLREQEILARLHQTHIVPIHTAGEEAGLQYFVMPYIAGVSLHRLVQTLAGLPREETGSRTPSLAQLVERASSTDGQKTATPTEAYEQDDFGVRRGSPLSFLSPGAETQRKQSGDPRRTPRRLSPAYFRSVAKLVADAAEAVQHAHDAGVLHRDLKPGNVLIDAAGQCWLIDFGLGGHVHETPADAATALAQPVTVSGVMGTPFYMAPEQFDGKADVRTDVWGLGATLYELLALRRPFDGATSDEVRERVRTGEPQAGLVANVPADLTAVCRKAMAKSPGERYASARELCEDLRRWLNGEPTRARGAGPVRRAALWAMRNKGWAGAIAAGVLATLALGVGGFVQARRARADLEYAAMLAPIEQIRMGERRQGWRKRAWELIRQAAQHRVDDSLRAQAAATLAGMDAEQIAVFKGEQASSVAFDAKGERLLLGGLDGIPARLCEVKSSKVLLRSRYCGPGPVGFPRDETPLQLVVDPEDRGRLLLWDVSGQKLVRSFRLPNVKGAMLAMTPDGAFVAACLGGRLIVRQTETGTVVMESPALATALALAPDGSHVAVGGEDGRILVWALPSRKLIADLRDSRHRLLCLTFQRNRRRSSTNDRTPGWLIAAGGKGGNLIIWDLALRIPRSRFREAALEVHALAFSPDGTILAASAIGDLRLWDVATGKPLLRLNGGYLPPGLAFSREGSRLASAGSRVPFGPSDATVWNLENGSGLRSLRGLAAAASAVSFSSDGQYLAALSHSWQVAIWNVRKGLLLHILDVPQGELADNAALAFGPDDRFVFVSGTRATLWELSPDKVAVLQKWTLPPGRVDRVAFPTLDRLILWRMEGERELDGRDPWGPWEKNPRVLRARNLLGPNPPGPLATVRDFKRRTFNGMVTPDGQLFVAGGAGGEKGDQVSVAAFETIGGMKRWQVAGRGGTALDPTGKHVAVSVDDTRIVIKAVADGHEVERLTGEGCVLGPSSARRFAFIAQSADSGRVGFRLVDRSDRDILLFMNSSLWDAARFDLTGRWFAWGNRDGTVTLCDIDEVFDRLEREGLGWEKD